MRKSLNASYLTLTERINIGVHAPKISCDGVGAHGDGTRLSEHAETAIMHPDIAVIIVERARASVSSWLCWMDVGKESMANVIEDWIRMHDLHRDEHTPISASSIWHAQQHGKEEDISTLFKRQQYGGPEGNAWRAHTPQQQTPLISSVLPYDS